MNKHAHTLCGRHLWLCIVFGWERLAHTHSHTHVLTVASYMKLEDIASRFRKPCIMDIKVWSLTPHTLSRYTPHHTLHFQHLTYLTLHTIAPYTLRNSVYSVHPYSGLYMFVYASTHIHIDFTLTPLYTLTDW